MRENVKETERTITVDWQDGSKYSGEIENGKPHGQGKYTWPDGDEYVGRWMNGARHGLGCHSRRNGFVYIGEFKKNLPDGEGFYVGPDGTCFSGKWVQGVQQGKGTLRDKRKGLLYFGDWCNGSPKLAGKTTF